MELTDQICLQSLNLKYLPSFHLGFCQSQEIAMSEVEPTPEECLRATTIVDSDHPDVRAWASQHAKGSTDKERAIALYYKVRDGASGCHLEIATSPS